MSIYLKILIVAGILLLFTGFFIWFILYISNKVMNNLIEASINRINENYQEKYGRNATKVEILQNSIYPQEYCEKYLNKYYNG